MSSNIPMGSMSVGGRSNKALESPLSGSPDAMPVEASTAPLFAALPVKYDQQQQDYLSMLTLQHHQQGNLQGLGFGLYSSGVNLDFANSHGTASSMTRCYVNGGTASSHQQHQHHQQLQDQQQCENETQQSSNSCSSLPFATPIAFNGSYESSMTAGPFGYSYPNVAAFQTPIYGME
jgi:AP2-like factor (ANT lineage)